jgi:uncharacterized repeat protein (TIGR03806 family)
LHPGSTIHHAGMTASAGPVARAALLIGMVASLATIAVVVAPKADEVSPTAAARPYLAMPNQANGSLPRLLSQTGAFAMVASLTPADGLIPFTVNAPLWSDGARKERWMALPPGGRIAFAERGAWGFPSGTVFVKHFALPYDEREPGRLRRLETRLLVRDAADGVYGVTYRWREDGSDAELLDDGRDEDIPVLTADGPRRQRWHYPARGECLQCHNPATGGVLGVNTRQLNDHAGGQLRAWNHLFSEPLTEAALAALPRLTPLGDVHAGIADRARSYLDANCSHCHRPGAVGFANFDARFDTPLAEQNLIGGRVVIDHGIDRARNLMPQDPWRSMMLVRMEADDALRMPPLARNVVDRDGVAVMRAWIASLPGKPALAPPRLEPAGGESAAPVTVTLAHDDAQAELRYTLDGSAPDSGSATYAGPLTISSPTTLRVKALRAGFASSITVTATYIVR